MEDAIRKAGVLLEALEWIKRFQNRYVVVKLGGSTLDEFENVKSFLSDIVFMATVGMKPVIVHGGGKAISSAMKEADIEPNFVQGLRYTDDKILEIASRVLVEDICASLAEEIEKQGAVAKPLHYRTKNCLEAERLLLKDDDGKETDLGHVGQLTGIDRELIDEESQGGAIPIIPSIALDREGNRLNVNADTTASSVAEHLSAEKLVFLSDVAGIYADPNEPETLISHLDTKRCRELIEQGIVSTGMLPKVEAAFNALKSGVKKVHIVDGRMPHSVLLEIYSDRGVGTEIVT